MISIYQFILHSKNGIKIRTFINQSSDEGPRRNIEYRKSVHFTETRREKETERSPAKSPKLIDVDLFEETDYFDEKILHTTPKKKISTSSDHGLDLEKLTLSQKELSLEKKFNHDRKMQDEIRKSKLKTQALGLLFLSKQK